MGIGWGLYPFPCDVFVMYRIRTPALAPSACESRFDWFRYYKFLLTFFGCLLSEFHPASKPVLTSLIIKVPELVDS